MYAYYCFTKLHILPSTFVNLPINEKALVIAFIDEYTAQKKKEYDKIKAKTG
jgi:hypothetical protein